MKNISQELGECHFSVPAGHVKLLHELVAHEGGQASPHCVGNTCSSITDGQLLDLQFITINFSLWIHHPMRWYFIWNSSRKTWIYMNWKHGGRIKIQPINKLHNKRGCTSWNKHWIDAWLGQNVSRVYKAAKSIEKSQFSVILQDIPECLIRWLGLFNVLSIVVILFCLFSKWRFK